MLEDVNYKEKKGLQDFCSDLLCRFWVACLLVLLLDCGVTSAGNIDEVQITSKSPVDPQVEFYFRLPEKVNGKISASLKEGVLLLVPGFNGDGRMFLQEPIWTHFADQEDLILVSPSFHTTLEEIQANEGYYNPKLWSGDATLSALDKIAAKTGAKTDRILIFGFSAGAHFTNGFVLWKPERVKAFVCYSAAWWQAPTAALHDLPGLVMCGEDDERYNASLAFMRQGQELGLPWIWRSYKGTEHVMTPKIAKMAQAFLAHYARDVKPFRTGGIIGNMQTYEYFDEKSPEAGKIPKDLRITLPSKTVAEVWKQE